MSAQILATYGVPSSVRAFGGGDLLQAGKPAGGISLYANAPRSEREAMMGVELDPKGAASFTTSPMPWIVLFFVLFVMMNARARA